MPTTAAALVTVSYYIEDTHAGPFAGQFSSRSAAVTLSWLAELLTNHAQIRPDAEARVTVTTGTPGTVIDEFHGTVTTIRTATESRLAGR